MGVIQELSRNFLDAIRVTKSATIDKLSADRNYYKRKIMNLQAQLTSLRSAERVVLQKLNRYTKLNAIDSYYMPGREQTQDSISSIKESDYPKFPDPDARNNWARTQVMEGLDTYTKERDSIAAEIKGMQQEINLYTAEIANIEVKLSEMGADYETILYLDRIAKRTYSELYMLYEIHFRYRELTINADGDREFTDDPATLRILSRLNDMFMGIAGRNHYVTSGQMVLDYDDPGSQENSQIIPQFLERVRQVMSDDDVRKQTNKVTKYSNQLQGNLSDQYVGKNVSRQLDAKNVPEEDNAMDSVTKTVSDTVLKINKFLASDFSKRQALKAVESGGKYRAKRGFALYRLITFDAIGRAAEAAFEKKTQKLYNNIPFCSPPEKTEAEEAKDTQDAESTQIEELSAVQWSELFAKTKATTSSSVIQSTFTDKASKVISAVNSQTGKQNPGTKVLKVIYFTGQTAPSPKTSVTYTATTQYHVRILNNASRVVTYLVDEVGKGNLTEAGCNEYIDTLNDIIDQAYPEMKKEEYP